MKDKNQTLVINKDEADRIKKLLETVPKNRDECFGADETITHTVDFGDGIEMDIKLCGVEFEEGSENLPWTEAVLFDHGHQVAMCEPDDGYFKCWCLEYEGTAYTADVKAASKAPNPKRAVKPYHVACDTGYGRIMSYRVEADVDYTPESDNMAFLKEQVVKQYAPRESIADADNGLLCYWDGGFIEAEDLNIIAVSRMDL